jgi:hypothetical protein
LLYIFTNLFSLFWVESDYTFPRQCSKAALRFCTTFSSISEQIFSSDSLCLILLSLFVYSSLLRAVKTLMQSLRSARYSIADASCLNFKLLLDVPDLHLENHFLFKCYSLFRLFYSSSLIDKDTPLGCFSLQRLKKDCSATRVSLD